MDLVTNIGVVVLAAAGAIHIAELAWTRLGDRYRVLRLPGARVMVVGVWYRPGTVVYHPDLGRCRITQLDRHRGMGIPWAKVWPHTDIADAPAGLVPAAVWVPVMDLRATRDEAEDTE